MYCEVTYILINGRDYGSLLTTVLSFIQSTFASFVMRQDQNRSDFTFRSSSSFCWSLLIKTIAKLVKQGVFFFLCGWRFVWSSYRCQITRSSDIKKKKHACLQIFLFYFQSKEGRFPLTDLYPEGKKFEFYIGVCSTRNFNDHFFLNSSFHYVRDKRTPN